MVSLDHYFACIRISNGLSNITSCNPLFQVLDHFVAVHESLDLHVRDLFAFAAVNFTDDQILGYVYQTSGQVTRVSGTKSGIGQTFTSTMSGDEVLQYVKTFTEVRLDRKFDGVTGCICHQSSHTS